MITIVLMAGDGTRFKDAGYTEPKPFIKVNTDNTILDCTLMSLPALRDYDIYFTVRTDWHPRYISYLTSRYSGKLIQFNHITRGNLETAYISTQRISGCDERPVMFLDSDNKYEADNLMPFISKIQSDTFGVICCFDPIDASHKWGFVIPDENGMAKEILEKDPTALQRNGKPLIGNFYFSSITLFKTIAKNIIESNVMVKNEFFMTQAVQYMIDKNIPVYIYKSSKMIPLGTPEDLSNYMGSL